MEKENKIVTVKAPEIEYVYALLKELHKDLQYWWSIKLFPDNSGFIYEGEKVKFYFDNMPICILKLRGLIEKTKN